MVEKNLTIWPYMSVGICDPKFEILLCKHFEYCLSKNLRIELDMYPEGYNLYHNGAWKIIEKTSIKYNVPLDKITLKICEYNTDYPCKVIREKPYFLSVIDGHSKRWQYDFIGTHQYLFGHFIGRPSWDRLVLHDLIKNTNNALYSFWYGSTKPQFYQQTVQNIKQLYPQKFKYYKTLLDSMPSHNIQKLPDKKDFNTWHRAILNLKPFYKNIFVDVVNETDVVDSTCFITEKTARPILFKTPFIIMAGKNYIKSLKKLGFKTFDKWWDEDYDNFSGIKRIEKITEVIDYIKNLNNVDSIHTEMQEVIEYNYKHVINSKKVG